MCFATPTLRQAKPKSLEVRVDGQLHAGVTAKDLVLDLIGKLSTEEGAGLRHRYTGPCIRGLGMEQRMTVCNMSIEAARRRDDRPRCGHVRLPPRPSISPRRFAAAVARWEKLPSDAGGRYDRVEIFRGEDVVPQVTWARTRAGGGCRCRCPRSDHVSRCERADERLPGSRLHGPHRRHEDRRHPPRPRLHRLVHEQPDRRPAGRRQRRSAAIAWRRPCMRWWCRAAAT